MVIISQEGLSPIFLADRSDVISIIKNSEMLSEVNKFRLSRDDKVLEKVVVRLIEKIKDYDRNLLEIRPVSAELIMKSSGEDYAIKDYIADIVQFLSCKEVVNFLT